MIYDVHEKFLEKCKGISPFGEHIIGILELYPHLKVDEIREVAVGQIIYYSDSYHGLHIPLPETFEKFMVCLHEIGHGARNYQSRIYGMLMAEYLTECWALKVAKMLGFGKHSEMKDWVKRRVAGNMLECMRYVPCQVFYIPDLPAHMYKWIQYLFQIKGDMKAEVKWGDSISTTLRLWRRGEMLTLRWEGEILLRGVVI